MTQNRSLLPLETILHRQPSAWAVLVGGPQCPKLKGTVRFFEHPMGTMVITEIQGLPRQQKSCDSPVFGLHIHYGASCTGNRQDPFANAKTHYNPHSCPHPYHAGDLPPLFSARGCAFSAVLTDRFKVSEIIGKTIVLHGQPDDFTTQPSGNAGPKIACGEIKAGNGM